MRRERLTNILQKLPHARICVIGDLFLDKWVFIDPQLDEPSLETGLPAHQAVYTRTCPGAAGTVMKDLKALGVGYVSAVSLIGDDGDGFEVLRGLQSRGVDTARVIQSPKVVTPTYFKPLFLGQDGATEGSRVDFKNLHITPAELQDALMNALHAAAAQNDALLAVDQLTLADTGVVTQAVREALASAARGRPGLLVYADSRAFIGRFKDVIIKCNHIEAVRMTLGASLADDGPLAWESVFRALDSLSAQTGREPFVTCGAHGIAFRHGIKNTELPAARQDGPIDVCGAGDACSAGIVSALSVGADYREAAFLGMLASGVTVRKLGETGEASPEEIIQLYDEQFAQEAT